MRAAQSYLSALKPSEWERVHCHHSIYSRPRSMWLEALLVSPPLPLSDQAPKGNAYACLGVHTFSTTDEPPCTHIRKGAAAGHAAGRVAATYPRPRPVVDIMTGPAITLHLSVSKLPGVSAPVPCCCSWCLPWHLRAALGAIALTIRTNASRLSMTSTPPACLALQ